MPYSNSTRQLITIVLITASAMPLLSLHAQTAQTAPPAPATVSTNQKPKTSSHNSRKESDGERIFAQNCSRCHTAPDGFSSHISGTVVLHMRVRASLSQHDAQELMRFFNP